MYLSFMLRRTSSRSAMATKQQACSSQSPPAAAATSHQNYRKQVPSFFGSPRFRAFTKAIADQNQTHEVAMASSVISPTSHFSSSAFCCNNNYNSSFWDHVHDLVVTNPLRSPKVFSGNKHHQPIGLADLIDHHQVLLTNHDHHINNKPIQENSTPKPNATNNKVLFGTKLRVEIPPLPPNAPSGSAHQTECPVTVPDDPSELSEEYTCVISHGPNPKATHIFDNCVVEESYYSASASAAASDISDYVIDNYNNNHQPNSAPFNFLAFCYTCKKNLELKNDIYIYRGEKAFCSQECRYQEMLLDGEDEDEVED